MVIRGNQGGDESDEMCKTWEEQDCVNYELEEIPLLGNSWLVDGWE